MERLENKVSIETDGEFGLGKAICRTISCAGKFELPGFSHALHDAGKLFNTKGTYE